MNATSAKEIRMQHRLKLRNRHCVLFDLEFPFIRHLVFFRFG